MNSIFRKVAPMLLAAASVSPLFANAANTDSLGGYAILGAGVEYKPSEQWSVKLSGNNLLDKQYTTVRGYNTQGRSVLLSGRYSF